MSSSREVIWNRPERAARGPAPSLSREEIATAAVGLADTQGIEAVSMRALAVRLGVGAASLYRYVTRKDELIDLMVDAVMGSDLEFEVRGDWREDLRSFARGLRAMTLRHPWMAIQGASRRNLGPNTARRHEQMLAAIDGLGLEIDEMLVMIETLYAYVRGRTLEDISEQEAVRRSGLAQDEWMRAQTPYVQSLIDSGHYPILTRVVLDARAPHDPDQLAHGFDLGLERVLDGLATMLGLPLRNAAPSDK
jgi:AcrR family transcriptional regulator